MGRRTLVLYLAKSGGARLRIFDEKGMLAKEEGAEAVKHVRIEADGCSADVSFAEFEAAVVVRVSGAVSYERRNSVVGVRCVGDQG